MKYRMYVDEVGNPDLGSSDNPNHRYLSLTGVIIDLDYVKNKLNPELETFKANHFDHHPDDPIVLHRKEILNAKYPFENLRDSKIRENYDKDLLTLLKSWDYNVVSVCLDKKTHKDTYQVWRYDPYHYCLALLLERYVFFLEQHFIKGDVIAESRGGKEDRKLKTSFSKLWENGSDYVGPERFQNSSSKQLKVKSKANNISGLQIADLIAHPSRNKIFKDNELLEKELALFSEKIIDILQKKYYQREGRIFGKKFI